MKPLAIDLFCGLGGWTEALLAEGYDVIGFDNVRHEYGEHRYPGLLVVQDVTTLHGSQLKTAAVIVASPPCQEPSYRAMPWKKAKALNAAGPPVKFIELFEACFRLQREASEAAGRHIPLIVENVKGAQRWIGRARWNHGSFYLWGDVPALMPVTLRATKNNGGSWFNVAHNTASGKGQNPDGRNGDAIKLGGSWFHGYRKGQGPRNHGSKSKGRKMASAMIAKIPLPLGRHIAATFKPPAHESCATQRG